MLGKVGDGTMYCDLQNKSELSTADLYQFPTGTSSERFPFIFAGRSKEIGVHVRFDKSNADFQKKPRGLTDKQLIINI